MGGPMLDFEKYKDEWGTVTTIKYMVNLQLRKFRDSFILIMYNKKVMQLHSKILLKNKTHLWTVSQWWPKLHLTKEPGYR